MLYIIMVILLIISVSVKTLLSSKRLLDENLGIFSKVSISFEFVSKKLIKEFFIKESKMILIANNKNIKFFFIYLLK